MEQVVQTGEIDSFDNPTPVEPNQVESNGVESFDDGEVKELPDAKEQEQAEEKQDVKRETDKLEEQEKDPDDEKPEKEDDGKKGDDKSDEEEESDKPEDTGDKPKGKAIRLKNGDEFIDIDSEATVPVKVKGKKEFVSLSELQKNYSGHKAWTEEIGAAKQKQEELESQVETFTQQKEATKQHFAKIGEMLNDAFENPEADPLAAMKYLVDLGGYNVLDFEKKMMEHYGDLSSQFSEMSEHEQALYWTQRENQFLKDNQTARMREIEQRKASEQRQAQLSQVREQYGISEEDYSATEQELSQLGYDLKEITPEQVSKYAALKPHVAKADELCKDFEEDLADDEMEALITRTADTLYKYQELDPIEALKISARTLGYELEHPVEAERELERKAQKPNDRVAKRAVTKEDGYESFDDFEELVYGR